MRLEAFALGALQMSYYYYAFLNLGPGYKYIFIQIQFWSIYFNINNN